MDVSTAKDATDDVGGEEDTAKEVMEEAVVHIKMGLTSHMSPITLNNQSGTHSKTRQGKV